MFHYDPFDAPPGLPNYWGYAPVAWFAPHAGYASRREPAQSINLVTSHDGFTLEDLVSYDRKHDEANSEHNRDGSDHDLSWN